MIQPKNKKEKQILFEFTAEILRSNGRELDSSIITNVVGEIKKLQAPSPQFITLVCDALNKLGHNDLARNLNAKNQAKTPAPEAAEYDSNNDNDTSSNSNSSSSSSYSVVMSDNRIASNTNNEIATSSTMTEANAEDNNNNVMNYAQQAQRQGPTFRNATDAELSKPENSTFEKSDSMFDL